ncbi:unnamed protein product [Calypogeia fissa]
MAGQQIAKRIPRIKFPDRRAAAAAAAAAKSGAPPPSVGKSVPEASAATSAGSGSAGAASIQPRRPKVSKEEIEAVLLGGVVQ